MPSARHTINRAWGEIVTRRNAGTDVCGARPVNQLEREREQRRISERLDASRTPTKVNPTPKKPRCPHRWPFDRGCRAVAAATGSQKETAHLFHSLAGEPAPGS